MTLTLHLRRPAPDFDQVGALPAFGPVRPGRGTRDRYDSRPLATGPYRISRDSGQALVLVPNLAWSPEAGAAPVVVVFGDTASPPRR